MLQVKLMEVLPGQCVCVFSALPQCASNLTHVQVWTSVFSCMVTERHKIGIKHICKDAFIRTCVRAQTDC